MRVFFSSDHHFFHDNIIRYCARPFIDAKHMNDEMLRLWNSTVSNDDIVIYVGDLTASLRGRHEDLKNLISSLNGQKILVMGNHDHQSSQWYLEAGFKKVVDSINLGGILLIHYPLHEAISRGMDSSLWGVIEHVVHGHTHRVDVPNFENHFNVAADRHNFVPVSADVALPNHLRDGFIESLTTFINQQ